MRPRLSIATAGRRISIPAIRRLLRHFGPHVHPHRGAMAAAALCMLGAAATELLRPWPLKVIFDVILAPSRASDFATALAFLGGTTGALVAAVALSIVAIAGLHGLFEYGQSYLVASVGQKVVAGMRRQLYGHIQRLSRSFHDANHSGDLLVRLTGDIQLLRELLIASSIYLSERLLNLLAMISIMLWMDWRLALVALAVVPLLSLTVMGFSREIRGATRKQRREESRTAIMMSEAIASNTVVQAFAREAFEDERFARKHRSDLKAGLRTTRLEARMNRVVELVLAVGTGAVIWYGVERVLTGALSPGDLLVFTVYLAGMYKPIQKLSFLTSRIAKASVCGERIIAILETKPEVEDAPDAVPAPKFKGAITFEDVHFIYAGSATAPAVCGVSFAIEPGAIVAIVGHSGAGKSTIAKLLLRLYDPQRGRVLIDGTDIRRFTLASLREQIAVVLQEPLLFGTTVRDNIAYGKLEATDEEIVAAAKAANAHEFIEQLEQGYDTVVGERGVRLSGGQRQRIAIARALIREAPTVVLDEPMASLDAASEAEVEQALTRLMAGVTCLVITHDFHVAVRADLVLFLEAGRIVDSGTHRELLGRNLHYRRLYELKASRWTTVGAA